MKEEFQKFKEISRMLDSQVSPSFCLAKWYHSNIYFQTGETHSCYHPAPHAISESSIRENPAALHNTSHKIAEREQMLCGQRPEGCKYCWNVEDISKDLISDRQIRTGSLYKESRVLEARQKDRSATVSPSYIEVSFSNLCNFKCGYCHPKASSRFLSEIQQHGPYKESKNHRCDIDWFKIHPEENNPYLEAWWKWWPELSRSLRILRITGGEPLLQKSTFRLMDMLMQGSHSQLELNINSNLGSPTAVVEEMSSKAQALVDQGKISRFKLFTSMDTWSSQAEYVRYGLDLQLFERNLKTYLSQTSLPVTFMMTYNIFSIPRFHLLLEKILEWRREFQNAEQDPDRFHRIRFDISYLKEPLQFDINILPKDDFLPMVESSLRFIKDNMDDSSKEAFSFMEYQKLLRIHEYMKSTHYPDLKLREGRADFVAFFREYDQRKKLNLVETFPELKSFWDLCQNV